MTYTVTFYALRSDVGEITVSVHKVGKDGLSAYVSTPGATLAAVRTVKGDPRADGFKVVDTNGRVTLDYRDKPR